MIYTVFFSSITNIRHDQPTRSQHSPSTLLLTFFFLSFSIRLIDVMEWWLWRWHGCYWVSILNPIVFHTSITWTKFVFLNIKENSRHKVVSNDGAKNGQRGRWRPVTNKSPVEDGKPVAITLQVRLVLVGLIACFVIAYLPFWLAARTEGKKDDAGQLFIHEESKNNEFGNNNM